MTQTTIRVQMSQRTDTAANWTSANPILLSGEIGYESDTAKLKIGDGTTNWNSLAYRPAPASIDDLNDVDTTTVAPTDGQVLSWDNAASQWEPASLRTLLGISEYADDTAAGTGGLSTGELYYNTTSSSYVLKS